MSLASKKLGTLGAGNHYAEIQVVDEIYNDYAAKKMGIDHKGQVCVMIHSGSRGLGHQVATGNEDRGDGGRRPLDKEWKQQGHLLMCS